MTSTWSSSTMKKPITIRHCIQGLGKIAAEKPHLAGRIAARLVCFDPMGVRESMRKSILLDILRVLCSIKVRHQTAEIEGFIAKALTGGVLDKGSRGNRESPSASLNVFWRRRRELAQAGLRHLSAWG